jgi:hypothetical protein
VVHDVEEYFFIGQDCPQLPLRSHYTKVLHRFALSHKTHLLDSLHHTQNKNDTLVVMGDSLSRELFKALCAEIRRESKYSAEIISFMKTTPIDLKGKFPKSCEGGSHCTNTFNRLALYVRNKAKHLSTLIWYLRFNVIGRLEQFQTFINEMTANNRGVVLVLHFGHWYWYGVNARDWRKGNARFQHDLSILLNWIESKKRRGYGSL